MKTLDEVLTQMKQARIAAVALGLADAASFSLASATLEGKISVHRASQIIALDEQICAQLETDHRAVWPWSRWSEWTIDEVQLIADNAGCTFTTLGEGHDLVWFEEL